MNYRPQRVAKLIEEELSKLIIRELEFGDSLVTITGADVDGKLERAKIFVSVLPARPNPPAGGEDGPSSAAEKAMKILTKNAGRLQHLLLKKINIKPTPRIEFELDHGPENAAAVEKKILDIGQN